jgi:tetratricopeptide (TPR) repeat protein
VHSERSVDALLDRLSGLPLALTQAAAYIGQTAVSIGQYLEYYDTMWEDLMKQQEEYPLQEYAQRSVLTTWKISYEQVKSQSEEASKLLQVWSFLHAGDLWYELVSCAKEFGEETVVPEWLIVLAQNKLVFDGALRLLVKYSLVERKTETASYAMHSVLHSWCRSLVECEAERELYWKLALFIVGLTVPTDGTKEYCILERRLIPHGQALHIGLTSESKAERNLKVIWACQKLARMFLRHSRYTEAEGMFERALAGHEEALGPKHTSTLGTVNDLGVLYRVQGRLPEAEAMYRRALAGREEALGPKHTSTLGTVNDLGVLYRDQGRLPEAEAMYRRALAGKEEALGPKHLSTLRTAKNLADLYHDQGLSQKPEKSTASTPDREIFESDMGEQQPEQSTKT